MRARRSRRRRERVRRSWRGKEKRRNEEDQANEWMDLSFNDMDVDLDGRRRRLSAKDWLPDAGC
jgi:hypothetical protein